MPSSSKSRVVVTTTGEGIVVDAPRWSPEELSCATPPEERSEDSVVEGVGPARPTGEDRAYERGLEDGLAQGAEREAERVGETLAVLETAMAQFDSARPVWLDQVKKNLQALAIAVARQIIQRELQSDADAIGELVTRALGQFPIDVPLTIRLNPRDLSNISAAALERTGGDLAAGREVRWRPDPSMDPGGCVVEGPERLVDGRVDKALLRIYHELATDD